jgi:hypothetical protein
MIELNYRVSERFGRFAVSLCRCILLPLCICNSLRAATLPPAAKLVPPETALLVEIEDFSKFREAFSTTPLFKLYKDPAMSAFVEDFKTKFREQIKQRDNEILRLILDVNSLPEAKVAIASVLSAKPTDAETPIGESLVVIMQWGQAIDKVKQAAAKITAKAVDEGARKQTQEYRGVEISSFEREGQSLNHCFIDDCLIVCAELNVLQFVIAHLKGATSGTLADDPDYAATLRAVGPPSSNQLAVYVNVKHIIAINAAGDKTARTKTTLANLGLDNVIAAGISIDPGNFLTSASRPYCKGFVKIDGAKRGVCKVLDFESAPIAVPRFIPKDFSSILTFNLNIRSAYDEIYKIASGLDPQVAALLNMPLLPPSPQGDPGLMLKSDVVDHLGSGVLVAQGLSKTTAAPSPASSDMVASVFAVAVNNRAVLEKSIARLHRELARGSQPGATRELLGHTIYLVDLASFIPGQSRPMSQPQQTALPKLQDRDVPRPFPEVPQGTPSGAPPQPSKLALTVTDTHLVIGLESSVEQAIRTMSSPAGESLAAAAWFNKAKSQVPSTVGMAGLEDNAASAEPLWKTLRQSSKDKTPHTPDTPTPQVKINTAGMLTISGLDLFDYTLLPEFEAVRKYFGLSAAYALSRPDGFFFEFKYVQPN